MTFSEYSRFRQSTDLPSTRELPAGVYGCLGLAGEAGEVIDKIKKRHRDGGNFADFQDALCKELGDVLWYLDRIATDFGLSLEEVARTNRAKLQDRMNRGVLSGSGDNR